MPNPFDELKKAIEDMNNGVDNKQTRKVKKMLDIEGLEEVKINGQSVYKKEGK
jgi:hypothetical protein